MAIRSTLRFLICHIRTLRRWQSVRTRGHGAVKENLNIEKENEERPLKEMKVERLEKLMEE
eukprot:9833522-Heterocapsa_arctica.AAC.1